MDIRIDIKLLEFLEPEIGIPKEKSVNKFVLLNFEKPNPLPTNDKDEALILLKQLSNEGLIEYKKGAAFYWIGLFKNDNEICWWDNFNGDEFYEITRNGITFLDQYRISQTAKQTNESVKLTNRWTLRIIGTALFVAIINLGVVIYNNYNDNEMNGIKALLQSKLIQMDSLQSKLNQQQFLINHLLNQQNNKNKYTDTIYVKIQK